VPWAEMLAFKSREAAVRVRDDILANISTATNGSITIHDDFGCQLTVPAVAFRLIRLTGIAP